MWNIFLKSKVISGTQMGWGVTELATVRERKGRMEMSARSVKQKDPK